MGLLGDWLRSKRMRDPVRGSARVVDTSRAPDDAMSANLTMTLVVQAPGVPAQTVEHATMCAVKRWPWPDMVLPVTVDREDPTRLRVEWSEVSTARERARQQADALAASARGDAPAQPGAGLAGRLAGLAGDEETASVFHQGAMIDASGNPELHDAVLDALRQHGDTLRRHGVDVDALMGQAGVSGDVERVDDPAARLRKIDELHRSGAISDSERDVLRRRILDAL